jgi:hypothetical protein
MMHQMGIDHDKLSFPYLGLDRKLTGVVASNVVKKTIA